MKRLLIACLALTGCAPTKPTRYDDPEKMISCYVVGGVYARAISCVRIPQRPVQFLEGGDIAKEQARWGKAHTPYDLRRTYAHWMEEAGIPRTRRRLYMGHESADTTDRYERHDVTAFLAEDAKKLRDYLASHTKSHTPSLSEPVDASR